MNWTSEMIEYHTIIAFPASSKKYNSNKKNKNKIILY